MFYVFVQTVLAHGIYLSDNEIALLNERGTAVIHCPSSNTCLKSGLCDIQRLKSKGIKIGLGTGIYLLHIIFYYIIFTS